MPFISNIIILYINGSLARSSNQSFLSFLFFLHCAGRGRRTQQRGTNGDAGRRTLFFKIYLYCFLHKIEMQLQTTFSAFVNKKNKKIHWHNFCASVSKNCSFNSIKNNLQKRYSSHFNILPLYIILSSHHMQDVCFLRSFSFRGNMKRVLQLCKSIVDFKLSLVLC